MTWQIHFMATAQIGAGLFGIKTACMGWNTPPPTEKFPWRWFFAKMFFELAGFGFSGMALAGGVKMLIDAN